MTISNGNYENKIRKMTVEEAKIELSEWKDSYHCASREAIPDEKYLNKCIYYSGYIEAHIQLLEDGLQFPDEALKEYLITGYESTEKVVGPNNATSSRVNLPVDWRGKRVHIIRLDP